MLSTLNIPVLIKFDLAQSHINKPTLGARSVGTDCLKLQLKCEVKMQ